jgi:VanZ family protein
MGMEMTGIPTPTEKRGSRAFPNGFLPPWIPGLWAFLLTVGSMQPARVRPLSQGHDLHAVFHVFAFGTLGALAMLASSRWSRTLRIVCCLALGLLIEVVQAYAYPEAIEWQDVRDDTIGVVLFSVATLGIWSWLRRRGK